MKAAAIISLVTIVGLIAVLVFVEHQIRWPALENPPRQGEALDISALRRAEFVHSDRAIGRLIREPQNTWSNLAFVFAGALLIGRASSRIGRLVGAALVSVGIGSFLYHASASRALRHLDVGAMNGLFFTMVVFAAAHFSARVRAIVEERVWIVAFAASVFAIVITVARNVVIFGTKPMALTTVTAVAAAFLIAALIHELWRRRSMYVASRVGAAIGLFAAAVVCQMGDRPGGWLLSPDSPVQGHALWHVLSALALLVAVEVLGAPQTPNKAPEPTSTSVTPRATSRFSEMKQRTENRSEARAVPAAAVAHL